MNPSAMTASTATLDTFLANAMRVSSSNLDLGIRVRVGVVSDAGDGWLKVLDLDGIATLFPHNLDVSVRPLTEGERASISAELAGRAACSRVS